MRQQHQLSCSATMLAFALAELKYRSRSDSYFCVSAVTLRIMTGLSESGLKKARHQLVECGLIEYLNGENKRKVSQYRLLIEGDKFCPPMEPPMEPQKEPPKGEKTGSTTLLINNSFLKRENNVFARSKNGLIPLSELGTLVSDVDWLRQVISCLESITRDKIREEIIKIKYEEFITYLRAIGTTAKTEQDAKAHFVNWYKKELTESKRRNENFDSTILRNNDKDKFSNGNGW